MADEDSTSIDRLTKKTELVLPSIVENTEPTDPNFARSPLEMRMLNLFRALPLGYKENIIALASVIAGKNKHRPKHLKIVNENDSVSNSNHCAEKFDQNGKQWREIAPGVELSKEGWWFDEYRGTAEALVAAGLVLSEHFPGRPGNCKFQQTIFPDGTLPIDPQKIGMRSKEPGTRRVRRISKGRFDVTVILDQEEKERRYQLRMRAGNQCVIPTHLASVVPLFS